jgi:two component, sigma54 specific, transcriptional regulator, Fis family
VTSPLPICLIEDDLLMGETLCDRFALEGFKLDWYRDAASGERALSSKRYALVISDLRLPDRHGSELYRNLLGQYPALPPFIFITGYGTIDSAVDLLKLGACDYVTKPFDLDALVERVRKLLSAQ